MRPVVVHLVDNGGMVEATVVSAPQDSNLYGTRATFPADPPQQAGQGRVRAIGQDLAARLQGDRALLRFVIDEDGDAPYPLFLKIDMAAVAGWPWETLVEAEDFLALAHARPVVRLEGNVEDMAVPTFPAPSTIRILAVLSALGAPARREWEALRDSLTAAAQGLDFTVSLHVLAGELDLVAAIADEAIPWVRVDPIPTTAPGLLRHLNPLDDAQTPHILHLYCHGRVDGPRQTLCFATPRQFGAGEVGTGAVELAIPQLADAARRARTWMAVLNACDTATANLDGYSFAGQLVREGIPAAIGHRRPIEAADAHRVTRGLYFGVCAALQQAYQSGQRAPRVRWAAVLAEARAELCRDRDPASEDQWAQPCLFMHPDPFSIDIIGEEDATAANAISGQRSGALGALQALEGRDVPEGVLTAIRALGLPPIDGQMPL